MKNMGVIKIIGLAALIITMHSYSLAFASEGIENDLWKQHRQGKRQISNCFQKVAAGECYSNGLRDIVSTELALMNKGVSPKNPELVSRLLKDLKTSADLPVIAWKLIKHKIFRETGTVLTAWGSFNDEEFQVSLRESGELGNPVLVRLINNERRE